MASIETKASLLNEITMLPDAFLTAKPSDLQTLFKAPTLLHLSGKQQTTLFVSVMLHGNETTGFYAVQKLLKKYQTQDLPRNLSIFFGNIEAAEHDVRRLSKQPDYNRIWPGTEYQACTETRIAQQIVDIMSSRNLFASVDVHNNTGLNPHYACINRLDNQFQQLARLFGRLVVFFTQPLGVQSAAFAPHCPAVTLECGRPDHAIGIEHAFEFIDGCLHLDHLPEQAIPSQDIDLFHTVAQVYINHGVDFSFSDPNASLVLDSDVEKMNFFEMPVGTAIGKLSNTIAMPVTVKSETSQNVAEEFFQIVGNQLQFKKAAMPSMMTMDERVIKQDCLCYLMERLPS